MDGYVEIRRFSKVFGHKKMSDCKERMFCLCISLSFIGITESNPSLSASKLKAPVHDSEWEFLCLEGVFKNTFLKSD